MWGFLSPYLNFFLVRKNFCKSVSEFDKSSGEFGVQ